MVSDVLYCVRETVRETVRKVPGARSSRHTQPADHFHPTRNTGIHSVFTISQPEFAVFTLKWSVIGRYSRLPVRSPLVPVYSKGSASISLPLSMSS